MDLVQLRLVIKNTSGVKGTWVTFHSVGTPNPQPLTGDKSSSPVRLSEGRYPRPADGNLLRYSKNRPERC